jgi:hypothetical protein
MNRHRNIAKLVWLRTQIYCWSRFPRISSAFKITAKRYRVRARTPTFYRDYWMEDLALLAPGLYLAYYGYAELSDGWEHCVLVESVANHHSSNVKQYVALLHHFALVDPQYLGRKYRRQCFFFGYPGSSIEREQAMQWDWDWVTEEGCEFDPSLDTIKSLITWHQGNAADALVGTQLCVGVVGRSGSLNIMDMY